MPPQVGAVPSLPAQHGPPGVPQARAPGPSNASVLAPAPPSETRAGSLRLHVAKQASIRTRAAIRTASELSAGWLISGSGPRRHFIRVSAEWA